MTMFAPIYYPYLALIDSCMHMHFLNRVGWLVFWDKFWISGWLVFWDGGGTFFCENPNPTEVPLETNSCPCWIREQSESSLFYPSFPVYTILTCDSWRRGYCSLLYLYGLCLFNCLFSLSILLSNGGMISTVPFLLMGKILIILSSHSSNVVCQHEKPSWLLLLYQFTLSCSLLGYGYSSLALGLLF